MLSERLIDRAASFLEPRVRRTPVELSPDLSERLGVPVWLKLENLQITGSFKIRGAWFACAELEREGVRELATCSAGNHGEGVAWAARDLGIRATIFVPKSVDAAKLEAMRALGANVETSAFDGYDDTERWALGETDRRGLPFLSAYDDDRVMAGNGGSVALEIAGQVPDATTFVMPVGGGGHSAGFVFATAARLPEAQFVLCQHEHSPALAQSLERGEAVTELPGIETLASGLEGGLGARTFEVLRPHALGFALVSEAEIRGAMRWMAARHQYLIEGSAAAGIAACFQKGFPTPKGPTVVFISGRNIALETLRGVLCEHES